MLERATNTRTLLTASIMAVTMTGIMIVGCSEEDGDTTATSSLGVVEIGPLLIPDAVDESDGVSAQFYGPKNSYTQQLLLLIGQLPEVKTELARFELEGYKYAPLYSFVLEGHIDSLDIDASISTFVMGYPGDEESRAIQVQHIAISEIPSFVSTAELVFLDPLDDSFERVATGVWGRTRLNPASNLFTGSESGLYKWSWGRWAKCALAAASGGCATGAALCAMSGPGWAVCTGGACAASAVGAMVGCAVGQALD